MRAHPGRTGSASRAVDAGHPGWRRQMSCHICGIAGGDAGEIPEATRRVAEHLHPLLHAPEHVHQGVGQHVRQVARGRQHLVVVLGRPSRGHPLPTACHMSRTRVDGVGLASPSTGVRITRRPSNRCSIDGRLHAAVLGSGDGMTRVRSFRARQADRRRSGPLRCTLALGAADVGDDGTLSHESRGEWPSMHVGHGTQGHRRGRSCRRRRTAFGRIRVESIDDAELDAPARGWRCCGCSRRTSPDQIPGGADHFASDPPMSPTPTMQSRDRSCAVACDDLRQGLRGSSCSRPRGPTVTRR